MKYLFFVLTILCGCSMIVEVTSIGCPRATPLQITQEELYEQLQEESFWTNKFISAPSFAASIRFPTEFTKLSVTQYVFQNPNSINAEVLTAISPQSMSLYYTKYKINVDPNQPIFQITRLVKQGVRSMSEDGTLNDTDISFSDSNSFPTLKFALVYRNEEENAWFNVFQSCDGEYAWAHIEVSTIEILQNQGKDPHIELSNKLDTVLYALNIDGGVIYNTTNHQ